MSQRIKFLMAATLWIGGIFFATLFSSTVPKSVNLVSSADLASEVQLHTSFTDAWAPGGHGVPFPFSRISSVVQANSDPRKMISSHDITLASVLLPHGRAPVSTIDKLTDFDFPRAVLGSGILENPYFIGYAEKAQQLEVISWNNDVGRFEFLEVKDYAPAKTPRVVFANRAACIQCHQGQAPIFPHEVWGDTNAGNFSHAVRDELLQQHPDGVYQGLPINNPGGARYFQTLVTLANDLLQMRRACARFCGGNLDCRQKLLTVAVVDHREARFLTTGQLNGLPDVTAVDERQWDTELRQNWPADAFEFPDYLISDLTPGPFDEFADRRFADPSVRRGAIQRIEPGSATLFANDAASTCLGFTDLDRAYLAQFKEPTLRNALKESGLLEAATRWPLGRRFMMTSLIKSLKGTVSRALQQDLGDSSLATVTTAEVAPENNSHGTLFTHYCNACHSPKGINIHIDDINYLKNYPGHKVWCKLSQGKMPPPQSGFPLPTTAERQSMVKLVAPPDKANCE